jgi:hypothetical protein
LIRLCGDGAVSNEAKLGSFFTREKAPLLHTEPGCSDPPTSDWPPRNGSRKMTRNGLNIDEATPEEHYLAQFLQVDVAVSLVLMRPENSFKE